MRGRCREAHDLTVGGLSHAAVFVFWIDGDAVGAIDQLAQHQQLGEKALAGTGRGHDHRVGVVQRPIERIQQHRCLAGAGEADKHPAFHRQRRPDERQRGRQRAGVQVARHQQLIASFGQATPEAAFLFPERASRMCQQRVELFLDAPGQLVELAQSLCAEQEVQADGKQPLLAALQTFTQALGVLERDFSLGVGDPFAAHCCQPRRLESGNLHAQRPHHLD